MEQCPICLEPIEYYDLKLQKCCNKYFHIKCIHQWLKNKNSCPLCRSEYLVLSPQEYLEIKDFFSKNNLPNIMIKIDIFLSGIYLCKKENNFIYFILIMFRLFKKLIKI